MRTTLRSGARSFDVRGGEGRSTGQDAVRFTGMEGAVAWLRRFSVEPGNMAALRRLVARVRPGDRVDCLEGEAVLRGVAALLLRGRIVIREEARAPLGSLDVQEGELEPVRGSDGRREKPAEFTWITVQMVGEDDKPIVGERYRITLPDGTVHEGRLDSEGLARFRGIEAGECEVTFPDLDEEAWVTVGTSSEM